MARSEAIGSDLFLPKAFGIWVQVRKPSRVDAAIADSWKSIQRSRQRFSVTYDPRLADEETYGR